MEAFDALLRAPGFGSLIDRLEGVIGTSLGDYCSQLAVDKPEAKAVKDAVWGMIGLEPYEVAVVDSPPFQRLRRIRQLGVGFLTYPTGGYSRFEHSLGALHQSERMLDAIALRSPDQRDDLLAQRRTVRLAALVHDIGHLPLSHVSERYYTEAESAGSEYLPMVEEWRADVAEHLQVSEPSLAECISLAIVLSQPFKELLRIASYTEEEVSGAAAAIAGRPPTVRTAFIGQLISNVIDADKLDYMFRDGYVTGVPVAVDLERLLFKLRAVDASPEDFIRGSEDLSVDDVLLAQMAKDDKALVLGTDVTGHRLVYDLAVSRDMLYERVYLHHKTRAAERIVMDILGVLDLHPVHLYGYDDSLFGSFGALRYPETRDLVAMLEERRLPRRAFALSYGFLVERAPEALKGRLPDLEQDAWERFDAALGNSQTRRALQDAIRERCGALADVLAVDETPAIWLDVPPEHPIPDDSQFMVIRADKQLAPGRSFSAQAAAHPHSAPDITFAFASGTARDLALVTIASEIAVYEEYGLVFGRATADHAKISAKAIQEMKRELEKRAPDLFDAYGELRPLSRYARHGNAVARVEALADKYRHYSNAVVSVDRIERFLDQFPEALVPPMLKVLESVRYLDRPVLGSKFIDFVKLEGDCVLVPLTRPIEKSAAHISYYFSDHPTPPPTVGLAEALRQDRDIVIYDDVLISGSQARSVIQQWFGEEMELDEELATPLADDEKKALRAHTVRFRFVYGETDELSAVAEVASAHGFAADVRAYADHADLGRLEDLAVPHDALVAFLALVGESLLWSTKHRENPTKWTRDRCHEFALGYGGCQRLVVMAHNCPTGTITPLWKAGRFRNADWIPLFPRRGEQPIGELVRQGADAFAHLLMLVEAIELPAGLRERVASATSAMNAGQAADARAELDKFLEHVFKLTESLGSDAVGELLGAVARARQAVADA